MKPQPQIGDVFDRWTVIGPPTGGSRNSVLCQCQCGTESMVRVHDLRRGCSTGCVTCRSDYRGEHNWGSDSQFAKDILRKYNLTWDRYLQMYEEQEHSCAACKEWSFLGYLHVDHDHMTNKTRGLLCRTCNLTEGRYKGQTDRLRLLADYMDYHALQK